MPNGLIVADDLTGALDTGHGFASHNREVTVNLLSSNERDRELPFTDDRDVISIDTNTRDCIPEIAEDQIGRIVAATEAKMTYKKIDSTLRGNVVPEVDAALDASGASVAVVAPAFPGTGRITHERIHRVDGEPLSDAGYGVSESDLTLFFERSRFPVIHIDLKVVNKGMCAVKHHLMEAANREKMLVTFDAVNKAHLATIADGAASIEEDVLYVGSGGLAEHIFIPGPSPGINMPPRTTGGVLAVVGSINAQTLSQLSIIPNEQVIKVDPVKAMLNPEITALDVNRKLVRKMKQDGWVVLTAATESHDVARTKEVIDILSTNSDTERDSHKKIDDPGSRIAQALALTTEKTMQRGNISELFLTGGGVARATLDALNARSLCLTGDCITDGIPEGWITEGPAAKTRVVTKAGGFGQVRAIIKCIEYLRAVDG